MSSQFQAMDVEDILTLDEIYPNKDRNLREMVKFVEMQMIEVQILASKEIVVMKCQKVKLNILENQLLNIGRQIDELACSQKINPLLYLKRNQYCDEWKVSHQKYEETRKSLEQMIKPLRSLHHHFLNLLKLQDTNDIHDKLQKSCETTTQSFQMDKDEKIYRKRFCFVRG